MASHPFSSCQGGQAASTWGPSTCRWGTRSCRQVNSQYGLLDPAVGDTGSLCSSGWPITPDVNQRCGQVSVFSFVAAFFQHRNPFCLVETGPHYCCTGYIRGNSFKYLILTLKCIDVFWFYVCLVGGCWLSCSGYQLSAAIGRRELNLGPLVTQPVFLPAEPSTAQFWIFSVA